MDITNKTLKDLEWLKIQNLVSLHLRTEEAKLLVPQILPSNDKDKIEILLNELDEAIGIHHRGNPASIMSGLKSPVVIFTRLKKKGICSPEDLRDLLHTVSSIRSFQDFFREIENRNNYKIFANRFSSLPEFYQLEQRLSNIVTPDGEINPEATPELKRLYSQKVRMRKSIEEKITNFVNQEFQTGILQDQFYDVREGRYVVPVKTEFQGKIDGILYGSSSTGQTVYKEPSFISKTNNDLREIENLIEVEIYRILKEISEELQDHIEHLESGYESLIAADLATAKAELAIAWDSNRPIFTDNFEIDLKEVYHPLLLTNKSRSQIVRNNVYVSEDKKILILSGPNTGGKTVLLKAIGLSILLAKSGFFIPASANSRIPFFENIITDLSDEQSIEGELSSFSGQITTINNLLNDAKNSTLILIDEILSSTDPEEAVPLSIAILSEFAKKGAHSLVSTHFQALKMAAFDRPAFQNASMTFNHEFKFGMPGKSGAIETAAKFGLPMNLIEEAKLIRNDSSAKIEQALDQIELIKSNLVGKEEEINSLKTKLEAEKLAFEKDLEKRLLNILDSTRKEIEEIVKAFEREERKNKIATRDVFGKVETVLYKKSPSLVIPESKEEKKIAFAPSWAKKESKKTTTPLKTHNTFGTKSLDLRGKTVEESIDELITTLDECAINNIAQLTIVHGHGTDKLKKAVREFLRKSQYIEKWEVAPQNMGGDGATIAYLK